MKSLYRVFLLAAVPFLISTSAMAFEGFSIGIMASSADFDTTGKELEGGGTASTTDNESNSGSAGNTVEFGSGFLEYTFAQGSTMGVSYIPGEASLGSKSRTDTTTDGNETNQDDSTYTAKAEVSDHWTFYVEPTIMTTESFGLYVKGGASKVTVNSLESISSGTDSSAYGNVDIWGVMYGAGIKGIHENGMFFKLEATKTEYGTVTLRSTTGNKNTITADPESETVSLHFGYNF